MTDYEKRMEQILIHEKKELKEHVSWLLNLVAQRNAKIASLEWELELEKRKGRNWK